MLFDLILIWYYTIHLNTPLTSSLWLVKEPRGNQRISKTVLVRSLTVTDTFRSNPLHLQRPLWHPLLGFGPEYFFPGYIWLPLPPFSNTAVFSVFRQSRKRGYWGVDCTCNTWYIPEGRITTVQWDCITLSLDLALLCDTIIIRV